MLKSLRGFLLLLVSAALAAQLVSVPALAGDTEGGSAAGVGEVPLVTQAEGDSGTFHGMDWRITSDGGLVLGRNGKEQSLANGSWMSSSAWPWHGRRGSITSVRVEGTIRASGNLAYMFNGCSELASADLSGLDNSAATDMHSMFYGCSKLTSLDLSNWDISHVTDMHSMFSQCTSLASLNASGWDKSAVADMSHMFYNCSSLASLNPSKWDTSAVTDMDSMFYNCSSLTSLDISKWDTSHVTDMRWMFQGCSSLDTLGVSGWDTSAVTSMYDMFSRCSSLTSLDVSKWDTSHVTDMGSMFYDCSKLAYLDVSDWDTSAVTDMSVMFRFCSSLTSLDVSGWDTSHVTAMDSVFCDCPSIASLDVSRWDTSAAKDMGDMFHHCSSLTSLDVSGWDTSAVTSMRAMFCDCSKLASLDLSGWDTSAVTDTVWMFYDCTSLCRVRLGKDCTRMDELPNHAATGKMWLSEETGRWLTPEEIAEERLGVVDTYVAQNPFVDVDGNTPHCEEILWLAWQGISTGWPVEGGKAEFRGMSPVVRQDMAAFLYRLAGSPEYEPTADDRARFRDVDDSTPHCREIWWLASTGISQGWDMGGGVYEFRGMDTVKRQDMAAFLRRLAAQMGADTGSTSGGVTFSDVSESTPHYEDILWLASTGVTRGWDMGGGTFEYRGMSDVVRQDMAAFLLRLYAYVNKPLT